MIDMTKQVTVNKTGLQVLTHDRGQFFTFGQVTLLKKSDLIVLVSAGEQAGKKVRLPLTFPCTVDGVEYVVDAPEPVAAEDVKPKKAGPKRGEGPTKLDKCKAIFAEYKGKDFLKSTVVQRFIDEAACTPAGANTYFLLCKKAA